MDILVTINNGFDFSKIEEKLDFISKKEVSGVRFNLCKYNMEDSILFINRIADFLRKYEKRFRVILDIPFPQSKVRIKKSTVNDYVICNKEYNLLTSTATAKSINADIILNISKFDETIMKKKILYFGDGEGAFQIIEYSRNCLKVKALNSFKIYDNKSISCGVIKNAYIEPLLEEICKLSFLNIGIFFSFVDSYESIKVANSRLSKCGIKRYPKIEYNIAGEEIEKIVQCCSGAILARGDYALYSPMNELLIMETSIAKIARREGKRIMAATDILDSLYHRYYPSRADIIDLLILKEIGCTDVIIQSNFKRLDEAIYYIKTFFE